MIGMTQRKRSGLSITQTVQLKSTLTQRVDGIVAWVVKYRETHAHMVRRVTDEVLSCSDFARLPQWAQSETRGYYHGKSDMVSRYLTVFAYRAADDGRLYQTKLSAPLCDMPYWDELHDRLGRFNESCYSEHGTYWPCGKPYFVTPNPAHAPTQETVQ